MYSMHVRSNPAISEEELRLIKEFIAKDPDEVTLEECERVYDAETGDLRGFYAAIYATYVRGYLISKKARKR